MKPGFKAKESENHFILHHPDGDFIKVAKKGLSPESMLQIQELACGGEVKGYADGGGVKKSVGQLVQNQTGYMPDPIQGQGMPISAMPPTVEPQGPGGIEGFGQWLGNEANQALPDVGAILKPVARLGKGFASGFSPRSQQEKTSYSGAPGAYGDGTTPNSTPVANPAADAMDSHVKELTGARDKWMSSIQGEAAMLGKQSQEEVGIRGREMDQQDAIQGEYKFETDRLNGQIQHTIEAIQNKQIDPMKAWHDKGVPSKVASLIGIILGGVGGAMTGQGNPAMKVLQQQIDNDIKAQEAELGKKNTLLSHFMQQYNNLGMARQAATANLTAMVGAQLAMNSAKYGQSLAGLRGNAAAQELFMKSQGMIQPIASQAAAMRQSGNMGTDDPMRQLEILKNSKRVSPDEEKAIVKEYNDAQKTLANHQQVDKVMGDMSAQQSWGNRILNPIQSSERIDADMAQLIPLIQSVEPSKRINEVAMKELIRPLMIKLYSGKATREHTIEAIHSIIDTQSPGAGTMESKRMTIPTYVKTGKAPAMTPGLTVGKR